jgi:hypothetical protein
MEFFTASGKIVYLRGVVTPKLFAQFTEPMYVVLAEKRELESQKKR